MKDLSYINVSDEVTKADGTNDGIWYFGDRINLDEDLIIGLSPTNYHCFVISGEQEFHARFSINPCKLQPSRKNNIRAALFFRFKGIPKEELKAFQNFLIAMKNKRTPSCHAGLVQVLILGLGLTVPGTTVGRVTPKTFLKILWEKGLFDRNGNKIQCEVYSTLNKSPQTIFADIDRIEAKYSWVFWLSKIHYFFLKFYKPEITVRKLA